MFPREADYLCSLDTDCLVHISDTARPTLGYERLTRLIDSYRVTVLSYEAVLMWHQSHSKVSPEGG